MVNMRLMKITSVVRHFGTQAKVSRALGVSRAMVCKWAAGHPMSDLMQLRIEKLTGGKVKADPEVRAKWESLVRTI